MAKKIIRIFILFQFLIILNACGLSGVFEDKTPTEQTQSIKDQKSPTSSASAGHIKPQKPSLSPMKGINTDPLFAEKITDHDQRFDRLESVVSDMRKQIDSLKPKLFNPQKPTDPIILVQEKDENPSYEQATLNIKQIQDNQPTTNKKKIEKKEKTCPPLPTPKITQNKNQKIPASSAGNFRIGDYPDKIRIVIDLSQEKKVTTDYDPQEKLIVIEIPQFKWVGAKNKIFSHSPLINTYTVTQTDAGTTLAVSLKKPAKILKSGFVDPDENPNYRYYLDIGAQ